jgi:uncharacterized protein
MMILPITSITAALGAGVMLVTSVRAMLLRKQKQIGLGDGGDKEMLKRTRIHGNAVENIPITLLLLLVAELQGLWPLVLVIAGAGLVIGRVAHAYGVSKSTGASVGRVAGMALTWFAQIILIVALLLSATGLLIAH